MAIVVARNRGISRSRKNHPIASLPLDSFNLDNRKAWKLRLESASERMVVFDGLLFEIDGDARWFEECDGEISITKVFPLRNSRLLHADRYSATGAKGTTAFAITIMNGMTSISVFVFERRDVQARF